MVVDSTYVERTTTESAKLSIDVESTTIEKRTVQSTRCTSVAVACLPNYERQIDEDTNDLSAHAGGLNGGVWATDRGWCDRGDLEPEYLHHHEDGRDEACLEREAHEGNQGDRLQDRARDSDARRSQTLRQRCRRGRGRSDGVPLNLTPTVLPIRTTTAPAITPTVR